MYVRAASVERSTAPALQPPVLADETLCDLRFRALLGAEAWLRLPAAVRRRFSKRIADGGTAVYRGRVTALFMSRAGTVLAQLLRVAGAPLPLSPLAGHASVVAVTEDKASGGQVWSRLFVRESGFPQVIHSVKRFAGPTGLEEAIGFGIVMALTLSAEPNGLYFRSAGYALEIGLGRLPIPAFLTPGALTVSHENVSDTTFLFTLTLVHPRFGTLIRQDVLYEEVSA